VLTRPRRADLLLLALVSIVNVLALPREQYIGDPVAIRMETVHLLRTGSLGVPAEIASRMGERGQYFYENREKGRWFSKYGVLNTFLYVPPLVAERLATGSLPWISPARLAFLNAFNVVLALCSAAYLLATVGLYTRDAAVKWVYVLSAFYATFWWNYLRAQTVEIYQTLFVIALYYHLVRHLRPPDDEWLHLRAATPRGTHLALSTLYLAALCLGKLSFVIFVPVVAAVLFAAERDRVRRPGGEREDGHSPRLRLYLVSFVVPVLCLGVLIAAINRYKFGSPLLTGYEQLAQERDVLGGDLLTGLRGFATSARGSILLHFPLLLFALGGYPAFFRKWPMETLALAASSLSLLLLNSRFANWQGDACYGPRYMLPVLPLASLPLVEVLAWIRARLRTAGGLAAAAALAVVLAGSVVLQLRVNALPFFAFHYARNAVLGHDDAPESTAFFDRPTGVVNRDLLRYWHGRATLSVLESARRRLDPATYESMRRGIDGVLRSNYLWFDVGPGRGPS
jgi:hypothetical protein